MLQQTRVETVKPYYERFLQRFPTVQALAEAPEDDVLALWSGLGYYRRARLLQAGARAVTALGAMPRARTELLDVPGIGPYTAGAVASIAFGEAVGLVDGNVARVLARLFGLEDDMRKAGMRKAQALADEIVDREAPGAFNQALMELGATVCTPRRPACDACPVASACVAKRDGKVDLLPVLGPKKKPEPRTVQALVASHEGRILFGRRAADRLFGGLWEPPSLEGGASSRRTLLAAFDARGARKVGTVTHVLSHRRLTVEVLRAEATGSAVEAAPWGDYVELRFVSNEELARFGVSTLARKILGVGVIW